ncbi:sensor histidine kinase [Paenibacillus lignilyticus]|uniref:histidine kinase n=1 Tax=Paenibacillus lignilyticus TaxID=1172615 RepID=A0ABS5C777_9BACL|nr:sensor histidine kinase [Paenibacillus lignilyticus]MBP3961853.1 sensor histidine kinase [Paenibacillus lignilyticus]MBP3963476.1 sensor histidine kinase [Paenibacillus lignilyticus]
MKRTLMGAFRFFYELKLKNKLILSFLALIVIPLGGYFYLSSEQAYKQFLDRTTFSVTRNFDQSFSFLAYKFQRIRAASDILVSEKMLNDVMTSEASAADFFTQYKDFLNIRPFLSSFENEQDISSVKLYVNDQLFYSEENWNLFSLGAAKKTAWFKRLMDSGKGILWAPGSYFESESLSSRTLSVLRPIRNQNDFSEFLGIVRLDIPESAIVDVLNNASPIRNSLTYIQNSSNEIVASSNPKLQQQYNIDLAETASSAEKGPHFVKVDHTSASMYLESRRIPDTDWYMVTAIPLKEIASESKLMLRKSVLLLIAIALIAFLLSIVISNYMTSRLTQIMRKMRNVQNGHIAALSLPPSKDEFGELIENYNFMVGKIELLLEEQYLSGQEVKNAELRALQAQINPHFLYNTLDMMKWMARSGMNDQIEQVVTSLSKFYKLSLSMGKTVISIRDELLHASSYMQVQTARYVNKIQLVVDVDEEIHDYGILKITLQPILENAIIHGILCKDSEAGEIRITGGLERGDIVIKVSDDGVGMQTEMVGMLLTDNSDNRTRDSGYGLRNIHERIRLFYGIDFGLAFHSEPGRGTQVTIRIPVQKLSSG